VIELNECEGIMELTTIMKSSKGRVNTKEGEMKIQKRGFEENNPRYKKFLSFRRNLIYKGEGEVNVESLKGGDEHEKGSSFFFHQI
jgi:hypothetical protein